MIERHLGRTDRSQIGWVEPQPRPTAEPDHGDVRRPVGLLALVDAEAFEPGLKGACKSLRARLALAEHDHAHALRLAVAARLEHRDRGLCGAVAESGEDRFELGDRPVAKEGEGDVEVVAGDEAAAGRQPELRLPLHEAIESRLREPERAEETDAVTAVEASRHERARSCRAVSEDAGEGEEPAQ